MAIKKLVKAAKKLIKIEEKYMEAPNQLMVAGSGLGCGVYTITGVSGYLKGKNSQYILHHAVQRLMDNLGHIKQGGLILLWSDRVDGKDRNGAAHLAALMKESNMAIDIIETVETGNFNYAYDKDHVCKVFCASVDLATVWEWAKLNNVEKTPPRKDMYRY